MTTDGEFTPDELAAMINPDNTVNLDPEGIATLADGSFIIAHEGRGTVGDTSRPVESPNLLLHVASDGIIKEVIPLP